MSVKKEHLRFELARALDDVAVVIPCFNDGAVVGDAVSSALREGAIHVVVVDDGSTAESTLQVLGQIEHDGIRVLRQPNRGLAAARTAGLHATTAPFVMVLDADDEIAPGALAVMAEALRLDDSLAVVWGDVERFGAAGYRLHPRGKVLDPWRITFVNELVASTMVRRSAVEAVGGWSLRDAYEDWDLWMTLAERGFAGRHVGMTTLRYRVDDPRMYRKALARHGDLMALLIERHAALFKQRRYHRRRSQSGWVLKFLWTLFGALPVAASAKRYLFFGALVLSEPSMRRRRRRR